MAIPDYQTFMLPLLRYLADGQPHAASKVADALAQEFGLTPEEKKQTFPSDGQPIYRNRVRWARIHLAKAGLLEMPKHGYWQISDEGKRVLENNPEAINNQYLSRYASFREFRRGF